MDKQNAALAAIREQERIKRILTCQAAKGRFKAAMSLALHTDSDPGAAMKALAKMPKEKAAMPDPVATFVREQRLKQGVSNLSEVSTNEQE